MYKKVVATISYLLSEIINWELKNTCRHTKNKSWRRCRLYFRGGMQCWWIFDFETDYMKMFMFEGNQFKRTRPARPESFQVAREHKHRVMPVVHTTFYISLHLNLWTFKKFINIELDFAKFPSLRWLVSMTIC
jgi:hypothetical protein